MGNGRALGSEEELRNSRPQRAGSTGVKPLLPLGQATWGQQEEEVMNHKLITGGSPKEEGAQERVSARVEESSGRREHAAVSQEGGKPAAAVGRAGGRLDNSGLFYFLSYRDTQLKCKVLEKTLVLTAINFQIKYSHFEYA